MARKRQISPAFFLNPDLAEVDPMGRLLFIALWCVADCHGKLKDRPQVLKIQALPYDTCDIDELLWQLHPEFITRYEHDGDNFIFINKFERHQNCHPGEVESDIPSLDEGQIRTKPLTSNLQATYKQPASNLDATCQPGTSTSTPTSTPTSTSTSTPTSHSNLQVSDEQPAKRQRRKSELTQAQLVLFERWYAEYPEKKARGQAEKVWMPLNPDIELTEHMVAAVRKQKAWRERIAAVGEQVTRWKYPATWLRAKCWMDVVDEPASSEKDKKKLEYADKWHPETGKETNNV